MVYYDLTNGVIYNAKREAEQEIHRGIQAKVVETMQGEGLSHKEAEREFGLPHKRGAARERIYLEEGPEGLYIERRGCGSKGRPPKKLSPEVEEDLLAEVQRLRAENAYLKN